MDCITKTVFPDGRIRISDGTQIRTLRLDELLDPENEWGLRVEVCEFQASEESAFHDESTDTYGLYANPIWWELVVAKNELEHCPDIYWFGEKVVTFINGEMVILPLLARVGDIYSGTQTEGVLEAVGAIAAAMRAHAQIDEEDPDAYIASELGVTVKLLAQGEAYYRQLLEAERLALSGEYEDDYEEGYEPE